MKVEGLSTQQVKDILANHPVPDCPTVLKTHFVAKPYSGPGHTAAFAYGDIYTSLSKYGAVSTTGKYLTPWTACRHAATFAIRALLNKGATTVIFQKKHYSSWNSHKAILKSVTASYAKAGIGCTINCPLNGGLLVPAQAVIQAAAPKKVSDIAAQAPIAMLPLKGEIGAGEVFAVPAMAKMGDARRSMMVAVCTLYSLAEIETGFMLSPAPTSEHPDYIRYTIFQREFKAFMAAYAGRFARNLFDYLTLAAAGEARHTHQLRIGYSGGHPSSRSEVWGKAIGYDPRQILPALERIFLVGKWGGGFGGKKWAAIAKAAEKYLMFQGSPVVFADHCVDLSHNGGLAFDKGFIFKQPDLTQYMKVLDAKRDGSLLGSSLTLEIASAAYSFILQAASMGIIDRPTAKITLHDDPIIKTVAWGNQAVVLVPCDKETAEKVAQYDEKLVVEKAAVEAVAAVAEGGNVLLQSVEEFNAFHEALKTQKGQINPFVFVAGSAAEAEEYIKSLPVIGKKKEVVNG